MGTHDTRNDGKKVANKLLCGSLVTLLPSSQATIDIDFVVHFSPSLAIASGMQ